MRPEEFRDMDVQARNYRAPEILLGARYYNQSGACLRWHVWTATVAPNANTDGSTFGTAVLTMSDRQWTCGTCLGRARALRYPRRRC